MSAKNALEDRQTRRRRRRNVEEEIEEEIEEEEEIGLTEPKGRATPGRRIQETSDGNFITRPLRKVIGYVDNVRGELQKVTWPTREETVDLTRIVLATVIASALALGAISLVFSELFRVVAAAGAAAYYMRNGGGGSGGSGGRRSY